MDGDEDADTDSGDGSKEGCLLPVRATLGECPRSVGETIPTAITRVAGDGSWDGLQLVVLKFFKKFRWISLTGLFEDFDWMKINFYIERFSSFVDLQLCVARYEGRFTSVIIILLTFLCVI